MRDSMVFYRSFYDALRSLPIDVGYNAIMDIFAYAL